MLIKQKTDHFPYSSQLMLFSSELASRGGHVSARASASEAGWGTCCFVSSQWSDFVSHSFIGKFYTALWKAEDVEGVASQQLSAALL